MNNKLRAIIFVTLLIASSALVWWNFPQEEWQWFTWSFSGFSLLLIIAVLFWSYRRKPLRDIKLDEQQQLILHDIRVIKQLFTQATKKIRGRGSNKLKTFYDLPWYLLVGDENDRNTELLEQNGLELVIKHAPEDAENDKYLRFWSNDHFVVIEVGTCLFDDEGIDETLWEALSKQFIKYRPRQGLNGIVAVVNCENLLLGERNERQKLASLYQEAALTMSSTLKLNLPVYCVLSKLCAISDFVSFFECFSSNDLEKTFGMTFPCDTARRFDPSQFDEQSKRLLKSLGEQQFELLRNINANKSSSIVGLPYQLSIFLERVAEWLDDIGRENRVRDAVWIRGVYFLSTGQKDLEYDLLTQLVAERTDFDSNCIRDSQAGRRSYFASNLFSLAILPEKKITSINKFQNMAYLALCVMLSIIGIGSFYFLGSSLKDNWNQDEKWRSDVVKQIRFYSNDILKIESKESISDTITLLNELRVVAETGVESKPWYRKVSVNQNATAEKMVDVYQGQLKLILLPRVAELITSELSVYVKLGDQSKIFESLRYYQMLFDSKQLDIEEIQIFLLDILQDQGGTSFNDIQTFSKLVEDLFSSKYDNVLKINKELVSVATDNLEGLSPERLIYARIKSMPEYRSQVDVRRQLGDKFDTIFSFSDAFHGYLIPEIFTKKGYRELDLSVRSTLLRTHLRELKAIKGDSSSVSATDLVELSKQIQRLYFADYIYYWKDLINNIQIRKFATLNGLAFALKTAREPATSPILDVLGALVVNTTLAEEEKPDTDAAKKAARLVGLKSAGNVLNKANKLNRLAGDQLLRLQPSFVVNDAFSSYSHFVNGNGADNTPLDEFIQQFDFLNTYIDGAISSLNPGKTFHGYAMAHALGTQDAIHDFQHFGTKAPSTVAKWTKSIAKQSWHQVVNGTSSYIQAQWDERVYQYYISSIEGRFPFNLLGRGEVSLDDFIHFFKPQGRIDQFVDQLLKPFVYWDSDVLKLNEVEGKRLVVSKATLIQMQRARKIRNIFFGPTGQELRLTMAFKANSMSSTITTFEIRELGNIFVYRHGPRLWTEVNWPKIGINDHLSVRFYHGENRVAIKSYHGPWALFRMLFDGDNSATNDGSIRMLVYKLGDKSIVLDYTLRGSNLVINTALFNEFHLQKRL